MTRRAGETQGDRTGVAPRAAPGRAAGRAGPVLALQRMAGNRAVAGLMRDATAGGGGAATRAHPASRVLVRIKGKTQGAFAGSGRDGTIEGWSYTFGVKAPHDPVSGQASGIRQYKAVTFKKPVDAASPQLMQALVTNEPLDVEIQLVSTQLKSDGSPAGVTETIILRNASVASFDEDSDDSSDSVSLTFQSVEIRNEPGATSAADKLAAP